MCFLKILMLAMFLLAGGAMPLAAQQATPVTESSTGPIMTAGTRKAPPPPPPLTPQEVFKKMGFL
ncbi:MAG: hypothetical protein WCN98_10255, partial [Verrucomicrobiaceae bacterium]